jgi:hypothetical protein
LRVTKIYLNVFSYIAVSEKTGSGGANGGLAINYNVGGGGMVVLASKTAVTNNGVISARGGDGGAAGGNVGHGGAGGGGIIVMVAPSVAGTGATFFEAGLNGTAGSVGTVASTPRYSGAGGGGSGGVGSSGGFVKPDGSSYDGGNSPTEGVVVNKQADPTAMFF